MRTFYKLILSFSSLCVITLPAFGNITLPKQARVPGGVAIIDLNIQSAKPPIVHYLGKRTCVIAKAKKANSWYTIIGIPIDAKAGTHNIEITKDNITKQQSFVIQTKKYKTEYLNIPNKRKVEPNPEDLAQIEKEYLETIATYDTWEQGAQLSNFRLTLPVVGRKSSPFGLQRVMNNIPKMPHSGLDIAAIRGTKVTCPKKGKVINIGNYFYSGNIVFIDHGQGFITSYCHLDTINVSKGEIINKGDKIGTVGNTGRATGPHLHWSVSLNGVRVDPELFLINK